MFFFCLALKRWRFASTTAFSAFLAGPSLGPKAGLVRTLYNESTFSLPKPACMRPICSQSNRVSAPMLSTCEGSVDTSSISGSTSRRGLCSRREVTWDIMRRSSLLFGLKRAFFLLLLTQAMQLLKWARALARLVE